MQRISISMISISLQLNGEVFGSHIREIAIYGTMTIGDRIVRPVVATDISSLLYAQGAHLFLFFFIFFLIQTFEG